MSLEGPNKLEGYIPKAEVKDYIRESLDELIDTDSESDRDWQTQLLGQADGFYGDLIDKKPFETFFDNFSKSKFLLDSLRKEPGIFDMVYSYLSLKKFDNPEEFEFLVYNATERYYEKLNNEKEKHIRILNNPYATEEEYQLGTYKESLETQVRDAVFKLQSKGYLPTGSGFDNLARGTQSIYFNYKEGVVETIKEKLGPNSKIPIIIDNDKIIMIIIPKNRKMPLNEWKHIWDTYAEYLPDITEISEKDENSDNGGQGVRFREAQDKIKKGKNAWLTSGLAFVNGKVVEMDYEGFKKIKENEKTNQ